MATFLEEFRDKSLKKFERLQPEDSELFKHQSFFKDFERKLESEAISDNFGVEVVETPLKSEIVPFTEANMKDAVKRFDIDDKFVQMNNAFFNSGFVLNTGNELGDAGTLRIVSSPKKNVFSKLVIVVGDGSNVNVVKECKSPDGESNLISEDILILTGSRSRVNFSELQNLNEKSVYFSNKIAVCGRESGITWNLGTFGGATCRSRTYNFLEGEGSTVEDLQLTFGGGDQRFDAFSNLVHIGRSTTAKCLAKGVFRDNSNSIFKGMIKIKETAKNAGSYLACHGMLLSKQAKANAIPSLEIETNDVKATHAASVSPIDEEKIFYLVSRGVEREEAKKMITLGYFDPLIRGISSDEIRAKIRYLIESKWRGEEVKSFDKSRLNEFVTEDAIKSGDIFEGHYKYR